VSTEIFLLALGTSHGKVFHKELMNFKQLLKSLIDIGRTSYHQIIEDFVLLIAML